MFTPWRHRRLLVQASGVNGFWLGEGLVVLSTWLLSATALLKLVSLLGSNKLLAVRDPLLHVTNRTIFACVGTAELIASVTLLATRMSLTGKQLTLGAFGVSMGIYRLLRWQMKVQTPCSCLGVFGQGLPFPKEWLDSILIACVVVWIAVGFCGFAQCVRGRRDHLQPANSEA